MTLIVVVFVRVVVAVVFLTVVMVVIAVSAVVVVVVVGVVVVVVVGVAVVVVIARSNISRCNRVLVLLITYQSSYIYSNVNISCSNHDHYGNVSAEIAYTGLSPRWTFPSYYYDRVSHLIRITVVQTACIVAFSTYILIGCLP